MTLISDRVEAPPKRYYEVDGQRYPRVTSIVNVLANPAIVDWKLKVGKEEAARVSKDATDWGTKLHKNIELYNLHGEPWPECDAEVVGYLEPYINWFAENVARVIACERLCVSRLFGFAGTCDALVELTNGALAILDYKSSKTGPWDGLKPDHGMQLAAYRLALAEEKLFVKRRIILQIPRNKVGTMRVWDYPNHREDTDAFLHCLELFNWLQRWEQGS